MGNKNFKRTAAMNNATYLQYIDRFTNITVSSIGWEGLPDEIDERYLELWLFYNGKMLLFRDDILEEFIVAKFTGQAPFTIYNEPFNRHAYTNTGISWDRTNNDSVIIYDNYINTSLYNECQLYAYRLYNIERTIDVNLSQQKTPYIFIVDESQLLSFKNMFMDIDGFNTKIYAAKKFRMEDIQFLTTNSEYKCDKLQTLKRQYINEYLTLVGISTGNSEKNERLVSDEVASNISPAFAYRNARLKRRRQAAKKFAEMYKLPTVPEPYFNYPDALNINTMFPTLEESEGDTVV